MTQAQYHYQVVQRWANYVDNRKEENMDFDEIVTRFCKDIYPHHDCEPLIAPIMKMYRTKEGLIHLMHFFGGMSFDIDKTLRERFKSSQ